MNNKKTLAMIAVAAIVVLAAAAICYFHYRDSGLAFTNPTIHLVDTASWKTYSNKKLGYSMKYPADLEVGANDPSLFSATFPQSYFTTVMKDYDNVTTSVATSCDPSALVSSTDSFVSGPTTVDGVTFMRTYGYSVGAGNHQSVNVYALPANGICYRIVFVSRGANDAGIYGGTPSEISAVNAGHAKDLARIQAVAETMLASFTVATSTAASTPK